MPDPGPADSLAPGLAPGLRFTIAARREFPLLLGALIFLLHACYGIAPILGTQARGVMFLTFSVVFVVLLGWFLVAYAFQPRRADPLSAALPGHLGAAFAVLMVTTAIYFNFPNRIAGPGMVVFLAIIGFLARSGRARHVVAASAVAIIVAMLVKLLVVGTGPEGADMLPVIKWADEQFLIGNNPYFEDYTHVTIGPFYYLPVQWLFYLPLVAAGMDQRVLNVAAVLAVIGLYFLVFGKSRDRIAYLGILVGIAASRPGTEMVFQGHVWPFWLLLSVYAGLVLHGRHMAAAVVLGVLLATSQTMLLVLALSAAYYLRELGLRRAVMIGLVNLIVYLAIVVPFTRWGIDFFVQNYYALPKLAGEYSERTFQNAVTQISLLNLTTTLGVKELRAPLQLAAVLAGMALLLWRRIPGPRYFLVISGLCFLWAIGLNVQVWKYYYVPGLLLVFWGLACPRAAPEAA
jgi:hypothetical protein